MDRRRLLVDVREGLAAAVGGRLAASGFAFRRRDAAFRREREGVIWTVSLGISSRPPALGYDGILVEPTLSADVSAWVNEMERRLATASGPVLQWERASHVVVLEHLDARVPGKAPHWVLPDVPTGADIDKVGGDLGRHIAGTAVPFIEAYRTPERLMAGAVAREFVAPSDALPTIACGAVLAGRHDLARELIAPIGTFRRELIAALLGL